MSRKVEDPNGEGDQTHNNTANKTETDETSNLKLLRERKTQIRFFETEELETKTLIQDDRGLEWSPVERQ